MDSPLKSYLIKVSSLPDPHRQLDEILDQLEPIERVALARAWRDWWARPEQVVPESSFRSIGFLTGRGWGKTTVIANTINERVRFGLSKRIMLIAQDEDAAWNVQIEGDDGLLAWAHPSCKAWIEDGHVCWENGAKATVFTPGSPGSIFGDQFDTGWFSELHEWPRATMMQAWNAADMCLRKRAALLFWDSNPKKKHPILTELIQRSEQFPTKHILRYGDTRDNIDNLNKDQVEEWVRKHEGTAYGRMMLEGKMTDEDDGAIFKQEWFDASRRARPLSFRRRIIAVDPATSLRKGTDETGIIEEGLGLDGQIYVLEDLTGKHKWEKWGDMILATYERDHCDCVIVERNRGGDACVANLRARSETRARIESDSCLNIVVLEDDAITRYVPGTVYVKEVIGRISKTSRGEPVASLCEEGKISFVDDRTFGALEDQLTTYIEEPGVKSPNNYDAFVWGAWELGGLAKKGVKTNNFAGVEKANRMLRSPPNTSALAAILRGNGGGRSL